MVRLILRLSVAEATGCQFDVMLKKMEPEWRRDKILTWKMTSYARNAPISFHLAHQPLELLMENLHIMMSHDIKFLSEVDITFSCHLDAMA